MDLALIPHGESAAPGPNDKALWGPEKEAAVQEAHDQLATILGPKTSDRLNVVEHLGTTLAVLGGILINVLPPPLSQAMFVLMGVGWQLRIVARIKKQTLEDAAEVVATFALIYHLIASKRHLCAYLQRHAMPTLNSMSAIADRLKAWVELAKGHGGIWGALKMPFTKFEDELYKIRRDVSEVRANVHFASTLAVAELVLSATHQQQQQRQRQKQGQRRPQLQDAFASAGRQTPHRSGDSELRYRAPVTFVEIPTEADMYPGSSRAAGAQHSAVRRGGTMLSDYGVIVEEEVEDGGKQSTTPTSIGHGNGSPFGSAHSQWSCDYSREDPSEVRARRQPSLRSSVSSGGGHLGSVASTGRTLSSYSSGDVTPTAAEPPQAWRGH